MKLSMFSGRGEVWSDWCLRFEPHRELPLNNTQMVAAAVLATPISVVSLGAPYASDIEEPVASPGDVVRQKGSGHC